MAKQVNYNEQPKPEEKPVEKTPQVIFWSRAERLSIANFVPEKKDLVGGFQQREQSLTFENHFFITDDPAKIDHIKNSSSFEANDCKIVRSIEEGQEFTRMERVMKLGDRQAHVSEEETTKIDIDEGGIRTTSVASTAR